MEDIMGRLEEQINNCQRIAATKSGEDRNGWLDDAVYYSQIIDRIAKAEAERNAALAREAGYRKALEQTCNIAEAFLKYFNPAIDLSSDKEDQWWSLHDQCERARQALDSPPSSIGAVVEAARDSCEICKGHNGGVPGNENVIEGKTVCDYCHAVLLGWKALFKLDGESG